MTSIEGIFVRSGTNAGSLNAQGLTFLYFPLNELSIRAISLQVSFVKDRAPRNNCFASCRAFPYVRSDTNAALWIAPFRILR